MTVSSFKSGFAAIVGSPNAGKSTLMNAMIGQKVAIVTSRAQTTRNRIMGVLTRKNSQIVFVDTPGIHTPKDKLGQYMVKTAYDALDEVECTLFMCDAAIGIKERDEAILERLKTARSPVIALINKIDRASMDSVDTMRERLERETWLHSVMKISALEKTGLDALEKTITALLPAGPMYFPEDMVTDMPERGVCAEFVREACMQLLDKEIPYGIGVDADKIAPRGDGMLDIWITIYCERESQKGIIIGRGGSMLKRIGTRARAQMEWLMGSRVNLKIWVKVKPDWRNSLRDLNELGYQ